MYTLEKYSSIRSRYTCPNCNKERQFTRYINIDTGEYLANHVGYCNRITNCGYHFTPKKYFQQDSNLYTPRKVSCKQTLTKAVNTSLSFIHQEYVDKSVNPTQKGRLNHFTRYLENLVGIQNTKELIDRFLIGTSKHWPGATVFWQMDLDNKVRTGKVMLYDVKTGKRVKKPYDHITWVHSILKKKRLVNSFCLQQCLFGLHQLYTDVNKPIGIVESEKTAIIASIYLPDLIWMATGSKQNLNSKMLSPIQTREIILFPDLNAYTLWKGKIKKIKKELGINIAISDLLEKKSTFSEKEKGFDLADYLTM